jgi:hypothetical protein
MKITDNSIYKQTATHQQVFLKSNFLQAAQKCSDARRAKP